MQKGVKRRQKADPASPVPAPFQHAPSSLEALLARLDPSRVYITHIDRHSAEHKRQIFLIPVLLNATIAVLLAWRLCVAWPAYRPILQTCLGYATSATVDTARTTRSEQLWILGKRTAMFAADFAIFRFIAVWPLTFFLERPANPVTWRWRLGFLKEEVVVRVSRNWETKDLLQGVKRGEHNAFFKTRVLPAIALGQMGKTGYLMMNGSWDLDFELMQDAHTLLKRGEINISDLDKLVLAHHEGTGWLAWNWEPEDRSVEDRRKKVVAFKDRLTAMGKESLFWKWTEIVEEERDGEGGFTVDRQQKVAERVKREFDRNGVDFDEVMRSVGGLAELPAKAG